MSTEIASIFISRAEEKFGKQRAEQLRAEIAQMAEDVEQLRKTSVEVEDEP